MLFRPEPYIGASRSYCGKDRYRTVPLWHQARGEVVYYIKDKTDPRRPLPCGTDRVYLKTFVAILNRERTP